jgi:hypothetical protein
VAGVLTPLTRPAKLVATSAFQAPCATVLGHNDAELSVSTPTKRVNPTSATVNAGRPDTDPYQPTRTRGTW